jgi:peptide/nickel transport system permease protein
MRWLVGKIGYGITVLLGVVTVVFFLFNLTPGDPVRSLVGDNASEEMVQNIRRKLDLDLPLGQRYVHYLNDLSPLSIHHFSDSTHRLFFDPKIYSGQRLLPLQGLTLYLKAPYLKRSFISDKSVSALLGEVMPGTIVLAVFSIFLSLLLGLVMGMIAALNKDGFYDQLMLLLSALGMAGPSFFIAMLVAYFGAIQWRDEIVMPWLPLVIAIFWIAVKSTKWGKSLPKWSGKSVMVLALGAFLASWMAPIWYFVHLPGTGLQMTGSLTSVHVWEGEYVDVKNMILPMITLMVRPLSVIVQLTRSSLLDVMQQDFIRTARAKGLPERRVIIVHGLRNALNPVITAVSGWFASLLAGAVFVEFVFGWKGLGQQMFNAIESRDLPVVMGGVIVIGFAFVVINLIVDMLYAWVDPRVKMNG